MTSPVTFTDQTIALVDAKLRGHCQNPDCYELAVISDCRTSLAYCYRHYWAEPDWLSFELYRHDTWRD